MRFKANCQRQRRDNIVVEHIGPGEVYIVCDNITSQRIHAAAVVLSKEDALALASTIINHYKVEQNGS